VAGTQFIFDATSQIISKIYPEMGDENKEAVRKADSLFIFGTTHQSIQ
jgi:hypothetical protein